MYLVLHQGTLDNTITVSKKKITIEMDKNTLINACIELISENGRPLSFLENSGFKKHFESSITVVHNTGVPWTLYKCSAKILKSVKKKFFQNKIILGFVGLFLYTKTLSLTFE
ncbi:hypothetical protein QTP88_008409 [Uroleucon formosanum]